VVFSCIFARKKSLKIWAASRSTNSTTSRKNGLFIQMSIHHPSLCLFTIRYHNQPRLKQRRLFFEKILHGDKIQHFLARQLFPPSRPSILICILCLVHHVVLIFFMGGESLQTLSRSNRILGPSKFEPCLLRTPLRREPVHH
jgi:hypothetical protein